MNARGRSILFGRSLIPACLLIVVLGAAAAARAGQVDVRIAEFAFSPGPITVTVGDTVTWTNEDRAPHDVTATDRAFRSETLRQGQRFSYTPATAGTFDYFCSLHPFMKGTLIVQAAPDQVESRSFPETGRTVKGPFLAYWRAHGGLAVNGLPLTEAFTETLEDGKPYMVQYFERVRLELHPENQAPYDVLLGQFGRSLHPVDPPAPRQEGAAYFPETGHNVREAFLQYWRANGGLEQFGYPISEELRETLEDGNAYTVQYFERARFELHPENQPPYDILLGQFGRRVLEQRSLLPHRVRVSGQY